MAIKGKKKKRSRQPARRPASAPRPVVAGARKPPWYKTTGGRVVAAVVLVVLVIGGLLWLKDSKQDAKALDQRKTEIESFTGDTQSLLQKISPDATEMVGARPDAKALEKDVDRWAKTFSDAQKDLTATIATAPKDVEIANRLIFQAVLQYAAAAETFKLIPDAPEKLQTKILERATAQVVSADGSWSTGVEALNAARAEVGLEAIALRAPSAATDPAGGTTVPTGG